MLLPLDGKPIRCRIFGITYYIAAPTDEVFFSLVAIDESYGATTEVRKKLFQDDKSAAIRWRDESVNKILVGWEGASDETGATIPFPTDGNPARALSFVVKMRILNFFHGWDAFTVDDVKNLWQRDNSASEVYGGTPSTVPVVKQTAEDTVSPDASGTAE
jgi:hypothetical protein